MFDIRWLPFASTICHNLDLLANGEGEPVVFQTLAVHEI